MPTDCPSSRPARQILNRRLWTAGEHVSDRQVSSHDYDRLTDRRGDLAEFLLEGPDFDALDLERSGAPPREVAL